MQHQAYKPRPLFTRNNISAGICVGIQLMLQKFGRKKKNTFTGAYWQGLM